jgi:NTP pyrophosphatase (non-canonical NTP hydrolase)
MIGSIEMKNYLKYINSLYPHNAERDEAFWVNSELIHATLGVAGESGEVVDIIKKHVAYGKELDREKLILELGDLFHYFCRVMELTDITLKEVRYANMEKLKKRYPEGYTNIAAIQQKDMEGK